jgi:hypothetical protein
MESSETSVGVERVVVLVTMAATVVVTPTTLITATSVMLTLIKLTCLVNPSSSLVDTVNRRYSVNLDKIFA